MGRAVEEATNFCFVLTLKVSFSVLQVSTEPRQTPQSQPVTVRAVLRYDSVTVVGNGNRHRVNRGIILKCKWRGNYVGQ
jgi:hypothetical protein